MKDTAMHGNRRVLAGLAVLAASTAFSTVAIAAVPAATNADNPSVSISYFDASKDVLDTGHVIAAHNDGPTIAGLIADNVTHTDVFALLATVIAGDRTDNLAATIATWTDRFVDIYGTAAANNDNDVTGLGDNVIRLHASGGAMAARARRDGGISTIRRAAPRRTARFADAATAGMRLAA